LLTGKNKQSQPLTRNLCWCLWWRRWIYAYDVRNNILMAD